MVIQQPKTLQLTSAGLMRIIAGFFVLLCWQLVMAGPHVVAQVSPTLFISKKTFKSDQQQLLSALEEKQPGIMRSRLAELNLSALPTKSQTVFTKQSIVLNLFDDTSLNVTFNKLRRWGPDLFVLIGQVRGRPESDATFVVNNKRATGAIRTGGKFYRVGPIQNSLHAILEIDPTSVELIDPDISQPNGQTSVSEGNNQPEATGKEGGKGGGKEDDKQDFRFISMLATYTQEARFTLLFDNIEEEIRLSVAVANSVFERSGIKHRLILAGISPVSASYIETGDVFEERDRLIDPQDGYLDEVHPLRDRVKADLVMLLLGKDDPDWGGAARGLGEQFAFSVVEASTFGVNSNTFTHEIGHNLGAKHDRFRLKEDDPDQYSYGYVNILQRWRTIMAYDDACEENEISCERLSLFSNPDISFGGDPTGISIGSLGAADNRTTINENGPTASRFRMLEANENADQFGNAVASGDFNNDGMMDLAIGARNETFEHSVDNPLDADFGVGQVYIFQGTPFGLAPSYAISQAGLDSNEESDHFGHALAVGDFNGDGIDDLAVTALEEAPEDISTPGRGAVYLYQGTNKDVLRPWQKLDQTVIDPNKRGDDFGFSLASADFNGDGKDDLVIGDYSADFDEVLNTGEVYLWLGFNFGLSQVGGLYQSFLDNSQLTDPFPMGLFGYGLATGDFTGDGIKDLAVGMPGFDAPGADNSGQVVLFKGSNTGLSFWETVTQEGLDSNELGDRFGERLAAGDLDGDDADDLVVGVPSKGTSLNSAVGRVYVFQGASYGMLPWRALTQQGLDTDEPGDGFGSAVAIGDVDADRSADLVVGANGEDLELSSTLHSSGSVYVFKNQNGDLLPGKVLEQAGLSTPRSGDFFGGGLTGALAIADFDADGVQDLAVGAGRKSIASGPKSGAVFIFKGQDSQESFTGPEPWRLLHQEE